MAGLEDLNRLERWAQKVLDESTRLSEYLTDDELREQEALWYADYFTLKDGWLVASPDDPAMRERLIGAEGMSPDLADEVIAKMRELGAVRAGA